MAKDNKKQGVKKMYDYFLEYVNNGLTYNPYMYDADTHDEEFNEAITEFLGSMGELESIFSKFEDDLEKGKYDEYLEDN